MGAVLRETHVRALANWDSLRFSLNVTGTWTGVVVWLVWWPAWVVGVGVGSPVLGVGGLVV